VINSAERRRQLLAAIEAGNIHSQADAVRFLKKAGFVVTQATASRDLQALGAVRGRGSGGGMTYQISPRLNRLGAEILSIERSENLLVIKTPPGAAQLVAGIIDQSSIASILGTIAGDDTIFIALANRSKGASVSRSIGQLIDGKIPSRSGKSRQEQIKRSQVKRRGLR
jgi:transcriptional regulator of arginine metabolism